MLIVLASFTQDRAHRPTLTHCTTDTGSIAVDFGVTAVPESYLVAPTGIVVDKLIGGVTADQLDARIERLLEQAEAA